VSKKAADRKEDKEEMNRFRCLSFILCIALAVGCARSSTISQRRGKPLEYFQTYNFSADINAVKNVVHTVLEERGFVIQKEDAIQVTALNAELTSVEILTYSVERLKPAQSLFSGEVLLTVDFLDAPGGGTFVHIRPKIKAVIGRTTLLQNPDWKGGMVTLTSRGDLENEILKALARKLKEKKSLEILITRGIELEGGFTL
jgi:hypothetical protein